MKAVAQAQVCTLHVWETIPRVSVLLCRAGCSSARPLLSGFPVLSPWALLQSGVCLLPHPVFLGRLLVLVGTSPAVGPRKEVARGLHTLLGPACPSWASVPLLVRSCRSSRLPLALGIPILSSSPLELMCSLPRSSSHLLVLLTRWWRLYPGAF